MAPIPFNPIQELERLLDVGDSLPRIRHLIREVVKQPDLPPDFAVRLLKFCVREDMEYLARHVITTQDIRTNTREGGELLWQALDNGQAKVVAQLARRGADLSVRKHADDRSLLHAVVRRKKIAKRQELVQLMLEHGADVNARDETGYSVLNDAIANKRCPVRLVEELLERGARLTTEAARRTNDLLWAARCKPEILPRLVEHETPDDETRHRRGFMAIEYLVSRWCVEDKKFKVAELVEKVLRLGISVNASDPLQHERYSQQPRPLLSTALFHEQIESVRWLLEHGADPNKTNDFGCTPLSQAVAFPSTQASKMLIEIGANIHERNDDGSCAIHRACEKKSIQNIYLLLNLGADLSVTDDKGRTPFGYTDDLNHWTSDFNSTHALLVKYLALAIAKGGRIDYKDMKKMRKHRVSHDFFEKCTTQLQCMKEQRICNDITYFALFSMGPLSRMQLFANSNFAENFAQNRKKRAQLFPQYSDMLLHYFEIAKEGYFMIQSEMEKLGQFFVDAIPAHAIEKITYYLNVEKLRRCQLDFLYVYLRESEKNQAREMKI